MSCVLWRRTFTKSTDRLNLRHLCLLPHLFFSTHIIVKWLTLCDSSGCLTLVLHKKLYLCWTGSVVTARLVAALKLFNRAIAIYEYYGFWLTHTVSVIYMFIFRGALLMSLPCTSMHSWSGICEHWCLRYLLVVQNAHLQINWIDTNNIRFHVSLSKVSTKRE